MDDNIKNKKNFNTRYKDLSEEVSFLEKKYISLYKIVSSKNIEL